MGWKYFNIDEFKCPCCGRNHMDREFITKLDVMRGICGVPFVITSGYRCPTYNLSIGGARKSAHKRGLAVDIACANSHHRFLMLDAFFKGQIKRIGIGKDFIHVDMDDTLPREVVWDYYE